MAKEFKIAVITAARSEYGLLQWIITDLENDPEVDLSLIVCGSHLSPAQGMTFHQIELDGHSIAKKIEFLLSTQTPNGLVKSCGVFSISLADTLSEITPDIIIILGDRYELLSICTAALLNNIPIAHISGGDVTEGAIDNQIRNAVTMLSSIHFPGTEESAKNIARMTGSKENVFNVGECGLDSFKRKPLLSRKDLADNLSLEIDKQWILCTLHPETKEPVNFSVAMAHSMMDALLRLDNVEIVVTASNADLGGDEMNNYFIETASKTPNVHYIPSLGQIRYLSFMNEAAILVGNTSSGIVEAPVIGIPVLNIGDRQKGRHLCENVISLPANDTEALSHALEKYLGKRFESDKFFGDGDASAKIITAVKDFLRCRK